MIEIKLKEIEMIEKKKENLKLTESKEDHKLLPFLNQNLEVNFDQCKQKIKKLENQILLKNQIIEDSEFNLINSQAVFKSDKELKIPRKFARQIKNLEAESKSLNALRLEYDLKYDSILRILEKLNPLVEEFNMHKREYTPTKESKNAEEHIITLREDVDTTKK